MTKGWISESARHSLAAKKIKTGRKKKQTTIGNARDLLGIPSGVIRNKSGKVMGVLMSDESEPDASIRKKMFKKEPQSLKNPETFFTDFFGGLGDLFVTKTEKAGEGVGFGLLGAGKKIKTKISGLGGTAEETGEGFITSVMKIGESLVTPVKKLRKSDED